MVKFIFDQLMRTSLVVLFNNLITFNYVGVVTGRNWTATKF
jgi:hypothetical protein